MTDPVEIEGVDVGPENELRIQSIVLGPTGLKVAAKKPINIVVVQITSENIHEVAEWCGGDVNGRNQDEIVVETLEGPMIAVIGSWIARGVEDEFYPIKKSIFEKTYDIVADL